MPSGRVSRDSSPSDRNISVQNEPAEIDQQHDKKRDLGILPGVLVAPFNEEELSVVVAPFMCSSQHGLPPSCHDREDYGQLCGISACGQGFLQFVLAGLDHPRISP